jgi:hypothetical protein
MIPVKPLSLLGGKARLAGGQRACPDLEGVVSRGNSLIIRMGIELMVRIIMKWPHNSLPLDGGGFGWG